ncbi:MAG: hypothetical protein Q8876_07625 [Bacillota bacterium]|nr:hypothetical protein [Bacillota bacterium]
MMDENAMFSYKGKPLVRCGNDIYYGSMEDRFVIRLQVKTTKKVKDLDVAEKITVQLMCTDPDIPPRKQVVKSSEKDGLYLAMDIGSVWLERALASKE